MNMSVPPTLAVNFNLVANKEGQIVSESLVVLRTSGSPCASVSGRCTQIVYRNAQILDDTQEI